ncbi:MAG: SDR family oxidoreductase, partial [bacterium]|nr:SDR family oxidoreductase [bacterium]
SISYVETHGTGTAMGDPIEFEGLKAAFNTDEKGFCAIGSVKTNVGHLDTAAGIAGFIKTLLALKYRVIPPSLHFNKPNPRIDFQNSPFYVATEPKEWKRGKYPLRAGVSSFGIGGTNVHVILEEAPAEETPAGETGPHQKEQEHRLIMLSAKTPAALQQAALNLAEYFENNPGINLADAAYTLQVGRKTFKHRMMLTGTGAGQIAGKIRNPGDGQLHTASVEKEKPPVVFMFPGQGAQYVNMGRGLYETQPVFREEMDRCFEILKPLMGFDIKEKVYPVRFKSEGNKNNLTGTGIAQPVIFAFQYALAKQVMKWGIEPYAMIGHSIGEYVAAQLSRVFSLEEALTVVVLRGKMMEQMPSGEMMSVPLSEAELQPYLDGDISIAAVNAPGLSVVSGPAPAIAALAAKLENEGKSTRRLYTSHAFHSHMMTPILGEFERAFARAVLRRNEPGIPYISNVTGTWVGLKQAADPAYWGRHLRSTVRFSDGIEEIVKKEQDTVFIEIGPGKALTTFVRQHRHGETAQQAVNLTRHPREKIPDDKYLLNKIGRLWLYGIKPCWHEIHGEGKRRRIPLPTYPFEGKYYWIEGDPLRMSAKGNVPQEKGKNSDISTWFYTPSWEQAALPIYPRRRISMPYTVLLFTDERGIGSQMAAKLQKNGNNPIRVQKGRGFEKKDDNHYIVDPSSAEDYNRLIDEVAETGAIPGAVIHLWTITNTVPAASASTIPAPQTKHGTAATDAEEAAYWKDRANRVEAALDSGFYSLINIVRAFSAGFPDNNELDIVVVSKDIHDVTGEENLSPEKSTLLGPCRVIPQEFPGIRCKNIDIDFHFPCEKGKENEKYIEEIFNEIAAQSPDQVVAYRRKKRWVQTFKPLRLEEPDDETPYLREGGVYMVTGGTGEHGSIGFILAKYIAQRVKAHFIFVSRTRMPPRETWQQWLLENEKENTISRRILQLKELETLGAGVLTLTADVSVPGQMKQAFEQAEKQFAPVNGVIHSAAVMGKKLLNLIIKDTEKSACNEQFVPKIYGLLTIAELLGDRTLDFCLVASSLASIMGPLAAYSAANNYMDTFVDKINREKETRWISVNWDNWQRLKEEDCSDENQFSMTPGEGVETFHRILSWGRENRVLVSCGHLGNRLDKLVTREEELFAGNPDISDWFYKPEWERCPLEGTAPLEKDGANSSRIAGGNNGRRGEGLLLFSNDTPFCRKLVEWLKETAALNGSENIIVVEPGKTFTAINSERYMISPGESADYDLLFEELEKNGEIPGKILHLWSLTHGSDNPHPLSVEEVDRTLETGMYSLMHMARAAGNARITREISMTVVSDKMQMVTGDEELCPPKAALLGPAKVIPVEYPDISCRSIDITIPAGDHGKETLFRELRREMGHQSPGFSEVAYRDNNRYVQTYKAVKLKNTGQFRQYRKKKNVYLVTGGLGGMGFYLAMELAKEPGTRIVLIDIAKMPPREEWPKHLAENGGEGKTGTGHNPGIVKKIKRIVQAERNGAEIAIIKADVSRKEQMEEALRQVKERFGTINGVIHAAGLVDYSGIIQTRTREQTAELLAAKVKGTLVLEQVLAGNPIDFMVFFSSVGNIHHEFK